MKKDILEYISQNKIANFIQKIPILSPVVEKAYITIRKYQEQKYLSESREITEFDIPEIENVYFREHNLDYKEIEWIQYILTQLNEGETLFDVGANIGSHSLPYSKKLNVIAFEPVNQNIERLEENIELNHSRSSKQRDVQIHQIALSDENGEVEFEVDPKMGGQGGRDSEASFVRVGDGTSITVTAETLDNLDIEKPDAIKIDIEGSEMKMLRGSNNILEIVRPQVFIETHPEKMELFGDSVEDLYRFFNERNYSQETIYSSGRKEFIHFIPK